MIKILSAKNGQPYFVVVAANGRVVATSETYKSMAGVKKGIAALGVVFNSDFKVKDCRHDRPA